MTNATRAYKRGINKQFSKYRKYFIQKLRSLKTSDPECYWSLLNKANSSSQSKLLQKILLEVFAEHLKKLNTTSEIYDNTYPEIDLTKIIDYNSILNCEITEEKVSKCIHKLKLNKVCSSYHILNEFFKHSKSFMSAAFTKLFNIVFTTGIVPDDWSQGIISPIYKTKGD